MSPHHCRARRTRLGRLRDMLLLRRRRRTACACELRGSGNVTVRGDDSEQAPFTIRL